MEAVYCDTHPLLPNRLTYPELFNSEINTNHFYNDYNELVIKLKDLLLRNVAQESLNVNTQQYDWAIIAPKYDAIINTLISNKVHNNID